MIQQHRNENDIFCDLSKLCQSRGFAHVIARFCFDSDYITFNGVAKPQDFLKLRSRNRLIRNEISTLIGLMVKDEIDLTMPGPKEMQFLINETERVLEELHNSFHHWISENNTLENFENAADLLDSVLGMREPIFYCGDSAYSFQHLDFSSIKYKNDNDWLKTSKGFYIEDAKQVIECLVQIQRQKLYQNTTTKSGKLEPNRELLNSFIFKGSEIVRLTNISKNVVDNVLNAFSIPRNKCNVNFNALNDFNEICASPIIPVSKDEYLLYQLYSLTQALYESPFYWFSDDKKYKDKSMENRGAFTEQLSKTRLEAVFGKENVFSNVVIRESKNQAIGEIDVLVVYANRAIVLQAKSKKLTFLARSGNDKALKNDFKKSIQDSYDQASLCADSIINEKNKLLENDSKIIDVDRSFKEIYIFCVVSDQYPALSFQSNSFLKYETSKIKMPPIVMDIFVLDVLCELLESPLQFLSYINRRALFYDRIFAESEFAILAYHLQQNLWLRDDSNLFLEDDFCTDIDASMAVRRRGLPGKRTPDGINSKIYKTRVGSWLLDIEKQVNIPALELGFFLLQLSEDSINEIVKATNFIAKRARSDYQNHNFSMMFGNGKEGLTIHCNLLNDELAIDRLHNHCDIKKYSEKAKRWFGICIDPYSQSIRFVIIEDTKWEWSMEKDECVRQFHETNNAGKLGIRKSEVNKAGRNDPCPCGSGKKAKKCCYAPKL